MLGLFVTPAVVAIGDALASALSSGASGAIAVVGNARLAAALGATREVIPVDLSPRAAKKLRGAARELSAIEPASLAALVGVDLAIAPGWEEALRSWSRAVRDGGAIVFVDRGHAHEASRRALCGGLTEIEQRRAGRSVVTSGLVSHFGPEDLAAPPAPTPPESG
ncbi:MAG TPA: hypothetical protein VHW23_38425 [Kofleriaceae bacterium]|nr:hypothetical protein [Kofleriaceae bacterium]